MSASAIRRSCGSPSAGSSRRRPPIAPSRTRASTSSSRARCRARWRRRPSSRRDRSRRGSPISTSGGAGGDRVLPAFERLLAEEWETALAVFHGGVNRILVSQALAGGRTYFGNFEQAPACINVLDHGDTGWIVRTVNYIPYDPLHPARTTTMEHLWAELKTWLDERA